MSYPHLSPDCADFHGLVRDFNGPQPTIVVLCGSTRFGHAFREANLCETLAGRIVLSIGCDTKSDDDLFVALDGITEAALKANLDTLHLRKIDLADEVLVLNVGGYIGESTRREIEYAAANNKPIRYLEAPAVLGNGEAGMSALPTTADLQAMLAEQKPGWYTHSCGAKGFMIPALPGPGVSRWCKECRVANDLWTRDAPTPRVYAMPDPPADLIRVRDRNGDEWVRGADALDWVKPAGRTVERHWGWTALLIACGPLTEVTDDHA